MSNFLQVLQSECLHEYKFIKFLVTVLFYFSCLLPMLETIHVLIKCAQIKMFFVSHYIEMIKKIQGQYIFNT
jgi:hypothetical protein